MGMHNSKNVSLLSTSFHILMQKVRLSTSKIRPPPLPFQKQVRTHTRTKLRDTLGNGLAY